MSTAEVSTENTSGVAGRRKAGPQKLARDSGENGDGNQEVLHLQYADGVSPRRGANVPPGTCRDFDPSSAKPRLLRR